MRPFGTSPRKTYPVDAPCCAPPNLCSEHLQASKLNSFKQNEVLTYPVDEEYEDIEEEDQPETQSLIPKEECDSNSTDKMTPATIDSSKPTPKVVAR